MHFWIDKRSQCAYSGRHRVPSSLSAGRSRGRVCAGGAGAGVGGARKGMAAPVHRFAAVDCPPRRPHRNHRHYPPPLVPTVHNNNRRQTDDSSIYVEIPMEPPQPTIASLAAARSVTPDTLLRTAALGLQHSPMMAPHLKFGMLVSFALATMFLAGAKYYFDKQVIRERGAGAGAGGNEAAVVCAAVACVCSLGCALSLCRAAPPPLQQPERVSSTARRATLAPRLAASTPLAQSDPSDDISLATLLHSDRSVPGESPEAPPPYKIAVLMPGRESPPPPAYSSLS